MAQKTVTPPSPQSRSRIARPRKAPNRRRGRCPLGQHDEGCACLSRDTGAVETRQLHRDKTPTPETGRRSRSSRAAAPDSTIGFRKSQPSHLPFERPATRLGKAARRQESTRPTEGRLGPDSRRDRSLPGPVWPAACYSARPARSRFNRPFLRSSCRGSEESATRPPFSFSSSSSPKPSISSS